MWQVGYNKVIYWLIVDITRALHCSQTTMKLTAELKPPKTSFCKRGYRNKSCIAKHTDLNLNGMIKSLALRPPILIYWLHVLRLVGNLRFLCQLDLFIVWVWANCHQVTELCRSTQYLWIYGSANQSTSINLRSELWLLSDCRRFSHVA